MEEKYTDSWPNSQRDKDENKEGEQIEIDENDYACENGRTNTMFSQTFRLQCFNTFLTLGKTVIFFPNRLKGVNV